MIHLKRTSHFHAMLPFYLCVVRKYLTIFEGAGQDVCNLARSLLRSNEDHSIKFARYIILVIRTPVFRGLFRLKGTCTEIDDW